MSEHSLGAQLVRSLDFESVYLWENEWEIGWEILWEIEWVP